MLEHRGPAWRHAPAALGTALLVAATVVGAQVALADAGNPRAPLSPYGEGGFTVGVAAVDRRITITSADDGSYVLGHTPAGGDVVLDLDLLSGDRAQPWWYDAATGRTLKMATLASAGVARFPVPKEGGGPAWVLVVDDIAAGYGSPDTEVVAQATGDGGADGGASAGAGASPAGTAGNSGSGMTAPGTDSSDASGSGSGDSGSGSGDSGSRSGDSGSSGSGAEGSGSGGSGSGSGGSEGTVAPGEDPASGSSPEQGRFGSSSGDSSGSVEDGQVSDDGSPEGSSSEEENPDQPEKGPDQGDPESDEQDADEPANDEPDAEQPEKAPKESPKKAPEEAPEKAPEEAPEEAPEKAPKNEPEKAPKKEPEGGADPSWDKLAQCESTGNWSINSGNGYYGGLQFDEATWGDFGGRKYAPRADKATKEQQIEIATKVRDARGGYSSWPACSSKLGLPK